MSQTKKRATRRKETNFSSDPFELDRPEVISRKDRPSPSNLDKIKNFKLKIGWDFVKIILYAIIGMAIILPLLTSPNPKGGMPDYMTSERREAIHMSESVNKGNTTTQIIGSTKTTEPKDQKDHDLMEWFTYNIQNNPLLIGVVVGGVFIFTKLLLDDYSFRRHKWPSVAIIVGLVAMLVLTTMKNMPTSSTQENETSSNSKVIDTLTYECEGGGVAKLSKQYTNDKGELIQEVTCEYPRGGP